jgi:hypothetical protein
LRADGIAMTEQAAQTERDSSHRQKAAQRDRSLSTC